MRNSPWYIVFLVAFIATAMGSIYFTSKVETVQVINKSVEQGRSRYGMSSEVHVLQTDHGRLPILKLPIIGYAFGAEDVYNRIRPGSEIQVRVGHWPPSLISRNAKPHILAVY